MTWPAMSRGISTRWSSGMLTPPPMEPRYGSPLGSTPIHSNRQHARSFFAAQTAGTEAPLTVWCNPVCPGKPLHHFVGQMIVDMRRNGLDPGLVLVDREFNSIMVIRTFEEMWEESLMPMIKRLVLGPDPKF